MHIYRERYGSCLEYKKLRIVHVYVDTWQGPFRVCVAPTTTPREVPLGLVRKPPSHSDLYGEIRLGALGDTLHVLLAVLSGTMVYNS